MSPKDCYLTDFRKKKRMSKNKGTKATKLYQDRQRAKGLCRCCPEPLSPDSTQLCAAHLDKQRSRFAQKVVVVPKKKRCKYMPVKNNVRAYIPVEVDLRRRTPEQKDATRLANNARKREEYKAYKAMRKKMGASTRLTHEEKMERLRIRTAAEKQELIENNHQVWLLWRDAHLKTCKDFTGLCCVGCHNVDRLEFDELENGDPSYLCCEKRLTAGLIGRSAPQNISRYAYHLNHAVSYEPKPLTMATHNKKDVAKLPKGLLKTWVMEQMEKVAA